MVVAWCLFARAYLYQVGAACQLHVHIYTQWIPRANPHVHMNTQWIPRANLHVHICTKWVPRANLHVHMNTQWPLHANLRVHTYAKWMQCINLHVQTNTKLAPRILLLKTIPKKEKNTLRCEIRENFELTFYKLHTTKA